MDNLYDDNNLNIQNNQNQSYLNKNNDERKSNILFNEIIDDLIRKKTDKENELKNKIEKNKKNLLEKFYSLAIPTESISNNEINNNDININKTENKNKNKLTKKLNTNLNNNNKNINIPNNINPNLIQDGQKEYDEIREKYKNERNKKKSSIFKSEDLRISNTNSVHLKKEDFSPINPNMVNQETKNNILIIQKKLFGDSEINEETSKVENIDEIDDLDFEDLNIKEFKNEENLNKNNNNSGKKNNNLDINNINFDLSSNLKSEINDKENNYVPNDILKVEKAVEYYYYGNINNNDINNKYDKLKDYKKTINRTKNYSVQLVSKLDYYIEDDNKNNYRNKKRKAGSNQEVMNEMNNFINNLIPQSMNNNLNNKFNGNNINYGFDNINNNININNINNNININEANLAEIFSHQQHLKNKNNINNNKNNSKKKKITNLQNNGAEHNYYNKNNSSIAKKTNFLNKNISIKKSLNNSNINQNQIIKDSKIKEEQKYKKIMISQKPFLNNFDININENVQKTKLKIKMNYRHISNSNMPIINKNNSKLSPNNQTINNIHKRKNNSVIIKRDTSKEKNENIKGTYLLNNNNRIIEKKKIYHFNTNNNCDSRSNCFTNLNDINSLKNNIKNIINQIPFYKNPLTTKNKKVSMSKIIKKKLNINNINYNGINNSNNNNNTNSNNSKNKEKKTNNNLYSSTGNKFAVLNTIHKNNLIKFSKLTNQIEAINKLKQNSFLGIYFIFAEKIKEGFLFKGVYKKASENNSICNKIFGVQNTPLYLSYENCLILVENNKKDFKPTKLNLINNNCNKTILLVPID